MWRVIQSAKVVQDTSNPCKTAILAGGKIYPVGASSWSDLTDKPFDAKTEIIEVVTEQRVTATQSNGDYFAAIVGYYDTLDYNGHTYVVEFNGNKYYCTASMEDVNESNTIMLGNCELVPHVYSDPEVVDVPFCITQSVYDPGELTLHTTEAGEFTLAILDEQETVTSLPAKFMPQPDMTITIDGNRGVSKVTADQLTITQGSTDNVFNAVRAGRQPNVRVLFRNKDDSAYDPYRQECVASVWLYGEGIYLYCTVHTTGVDTMYKHAIFLNESDVMTYSVCYVFNGTEAVN